MKNVAFCILIITLFTSCNGIRKTKDKVTDTISEVLQKPVIEDCSLFDKFPELEKDEFKINEITPDTAFTESDFAYFEREIQCPTEYEATKSHFFYAYKDLDLNELVFFTCTKTPEKHFLIFDLKNNNIYHLIENFKE